MPESTLCSFRSATVIRSFETVVTLSASNSLLTLEYVSGINGVKARINSLLTPESRNSFVFFFSLPSSKKKDKSSFSAMRDNVILKDSCPESIPHRLRMSSHGIPVSWRASKMNSMKSLMSLLQKRYSHSAIFFSITIKLKSNVSLSRGFK